MDIEVSFDIQDPKCDPEKLLKAFQRYKSRNAKVGPYSIRNNASYFKVGDLQSWFRYLYENNIGGFDIGEYPDIMYQLLHIWSETGLIRELFEDEKQSFAYLHNHDLRNQLWRFTKELD